MSIVTKPYKPAPPNYPRWYAKSIEGAFQKIHALVSHFFDKGGKNFFKSYFKAFVGLCGFKSRVAIDNINIAATAGAIQQGKRLLAYEVTRLARKHSVKIDQTRLTTIVKKDHLLGIL